MTAVEIGERRRAVVVEELTRTQIVQYAGASGDFNPIHIDETYAIGIAGLPSVLGHGMLTMAATARIATDWFGPSAVRSISASFRAPVWPGDSITATATVDDVDAGTGTVHLSLRAENQRGEAVLVGNATIDGTGSPSRAGTAVP